MLTPVLTVKTVASPAAAAASAATQSGERQVARPTVPPTTRSEAALRILETLNKHLVGAETLPKEALVRLLDTLSRLLDIEPLPRESMRDFGKRIAIAIESLPPAQRLALEKQLGQRNLVLSLRILAEVVKASPLLDASRQPAQFPRPAPVAVATPNAAQAATARNLPAVPSGQMQPQPTPQAPSSNNTNAASLPPMTAQPAALAFSPGGFDAGALQAALRSAFNVGEEMPADAHAPEDAGEAFELSLSQDQTSSPVEHADRGAALPPPIRQFPGADGDRIPALNAAARFLAGDHDALEQVIAIVSEGADEPFQEAMKQVLASDHPLESLLLAIEDVMNGAFDLESLSSAEPHAENLPSAAAEDMLPADPEQAEFTPYEAVADHPVFAEDTPSEAYLNETPAAPEDFHAVDAQQEQPTKDAPSRSEPQPSGQTARTVADALKTLIEVGIPLSSDGLNEPLEQLLAELPTQHIDDNQTMDTALPLKTGSVQERNVVSDELPMMQDSPTDIEENVSARSAAPATTAEDLQRDILPQKMPEAIFLRESLPFLAMPVAVKAESRLRVEEDDETRGFSKGEQQEQPSENDDQDENKRPEGDEAEQSADSTESTDAYELYSRLGGLT